VQAHVSKPITARPKALSLNMQRASVQLRRAPRSAPVAHPDVDAVACARPPSRPIRRLCLGAWRSHRTRAGRMGCRHTQAKSMEEAFALCADGMPPPQSATSQATPIAFAPPVRSAPTFPSSLARIRPRSSACFAVAKSTRLLFVLKTRLLFCGLRHRRDEKWRASAHRSTRRQQRLPYSSLPRSPAGAGSFHALVRRTNYCG
jgi:hypothetical protein